MNVFYEENGCFKVASVLVDADTSLHVETPHGKRSKIKANAVLLRFDNPQLAEFMTLAQGHADELDENFLWELYTPREFLFTDLALDYFGHAPSALEAASVILRLHSAPMHFYKKGKGHYKAAPADALKSALASAEKKQALALRQAQLTEQLIQHEFPSDFALIKDKLLYGQKDNSVEQKALMDACARSGLSPAKLFEKCGALPSIHDYHFNRLLFEYFAEERGCSTDARIADLSELALSPTAAFSIDDASTTEIDDAFSVVPLPNNGWRVGIHIAAPALGFMPGSQIDEGAGKRLSTVYYPGGKITMLPTAVINEFTLLQDTVRPVISLYLDIDSECIPTAVKTEIENIHIAANLRREELESGETLLAARPVNALWSNELNVLLQLSDQLRLLRGNVDNFDLSRIEYSIDVTNDRVTMLPRQRGSEIDRIVSELMIFANAEWGKQFAQNDIPGIYRSQFEGKVRMSTSPAPHQGLGVAQYLWSSSPLRRYVDLVNQRQLISWLTGVSVHYQKNSDSLFAIIRDFEFAYNVYNEFQRTMERYWCLRWLLQENITTWTAVVTRETIVRLDGAPLHTRLLSQTDVAAGTKIEVKISEIDLIELTVRCEFSRVLVD